MTTQREPVAVAERLVATARRRRLPPPEERRAIREGAGLAQSDLAEALEVHRETVARWEAGLRTPRGRLLDCYRELLDRLRSESL